MATPPTYLEPPGYGAPLLDGDEDSDTTLRMRQSVAQFEVAFEQEMAMERRRRVQLHQRANNRSRARHIQKTEQVGRVRFSILAAALTGTVIFVVFVMFQTLALIAGG